VDLVASRINVRAMANAVTSPRLTRERDNALMTSSIAAQSVNTPDVVYHYTNSAGLLGIIQNRELWFGDVDFMNDEQEIEYSREAVIAALEAKVDQLAQRMENAEDPLIENRIDIIRSTSTMLRDVSRRGMRPHAYAACFCSDGDLLSQWRSYAGAGGYAIGFRTSALRHIGTEAFGTVNLRKVAYGLEEGQDLLTTLVEGVALTTNAHVGVQAWHELLLKALPVAAMIKNPAFREEQEWRALVVTHRVADGVHFRTSNFGLSPYRKVGFGDDAITEIRIGPGDYSTIRIAAVEQLLESEGAEGVAITHSASPLRT
jgi:hypothetical protein